MQPLVSICIPTYNRATLIKNAIASAQAQTYPNIEIIVTDNCSTDDTEEVVRAMAAKDSRIRYIRNETNVGPTRNWQIAVNAAKGEYCKILFSDDEITNDFVDRCVELFNKGKDVAFVLTDTIAGPSLEKGKSIKNYCRPAGISSSKDYILNYLMWVSGADSPTCALFRTADLVSKIVTRDPYFEIDKYAKNGAGPDSLIFLNAASVHSEIAYIKSPLALFRTNEDSISIQASKDTALLTSLLCCYARARYHFLRNLIHSDEIKWYLQFLSTLTGAIRDKQVRKQNAQEFKLLHHHPLNVFDFIIGGILRQYRNRLVKPRIEIILNSTCGAAPSKSGTSSNRNRAKELN